MSERIANRRVNHRLPVRKLPHMRTLHIIPDGSWGIKIGFGRYDSKDMSPSRMEFYSPGAHSINRVNRLIDQKSPFVSVSSLLGLAIMYTFKRRVK